MVLPAIRNNRLHLHAIVIIIAILFCSCISVNAQSGIDSFLTKINPQQWSASVEKRVSKLEAKIIAKSQKTLARLQRQEEKLYRRMMRGKDSMQAKAALADIRNKYKGLQDKLTKPSAQSTIKQYIPKLDTLYGALKFLDKSGIGGNIKDALAKTENLQNCIQQAEEIKQFIRLRKQQLREQLEKLGLTKQLKKFNKQAYYFSIQLKEYTSLLKDSKKAERKALELLSKTKLFKDFMRKNSMLASLFRLPGDPGDPTSQAGSAGLQSRAQVNNLIQQQIASGGPNAQAQFRQNVQNAQSQLNQLKNKISQSGGGSSDDMMPEGFKPNNQKTKSFLQRLEFGTNLQTQKATNYFPVTSDIGLSIGYKLNDKSIIGVGASYKMGLGRGWNHVRITNEGIGLRSFVDLKLKGSFWFSGGYERNYKPQLSRILLSSPPTGGGGRKGAAWQQSGLVGVSKVISLKTKFFKKSKLQLLWDFLSYRQIPETTPILFRFSYNLK